MKTLITIIISMIMASCLTIEVVHAAVPQMMNYQGGLTSASGAPVDTTTSMTFTIFSDSGATNALWSETHPVVVVSKGLFQVLLGSVNPVPDSIFSGSLQYLGMQLGNGPSTSRPFPLVSVSYAFYASHADTAAVSLNTTGGPWMVSGADVYRSQGKVGIGTSKPSAMLDVQGAVDSNGTLISARFGNAFNHWTYFGDNNSGRIRGSGSGYLYLSSNPNGTGDKNLYLDASGANIIAWNGNVAVGRTQARSKLDVQGDISAYYSLKIYGDLENYHEIRHDYQSGWLVIDPIGDNGLSILGPTSTQVLTITGGSDIAEPFTVSHDDEIPAGSVVVIDPDHPGQLKLGSLAYDRRVAGIISGAGGVKPGVTLSQVGVLEGDRAVALSGKAYALATAINGAIQPGDLLTTSNIPGRVMKATDYDLAQGAIVGKAMTSLTVGDGLVLVLVNLQ